VGKICLSISSKMRIRHRCGPEQGPNWRGAEHDIHDVGRQVSRGRALVALASEGGESHNALAAGLEVR
jgi:hypothetical protein